MLLWIPITIAAAFIQNLRFMLQKQLKDRLSTLGVTVSRFLYAAPMAWLVLVLLLSRDDMSLPGITPEFLVYVAVGGIAQIVATAMLVALFSLKNFAVGVTFIKTETVMTAILSGILLGEFIGVGGWVAILVTVLGVLLISRIPNSGTLFRNLISRPALLGIGGGIVFSIASIGYRAASLALEDGGFLIRAALSLAVVTTFQTVVMVLWMVVREPGEIRKVLSHWRIGFWVGLTSMLGTLGWFSAFTLQNAAYVKALGQVELIFTLLASYFFFGEKSTRSELAGIFFIVAGILILVLV